MYEFYVEDILLINDFIRFSAFGEHNK